MGVGIDYSILYKPEGQKNILLCPRPLSLPPTFFHINCDLNSKEVS